MIVIEETWKDIENYPGYQVSNTGRIRSYWKKQKKFGSWGGTERVLTNESYILPSSDDGNGYLKVFMTDVDGVRHCRKIHRIVAEEFIPNPNNYDTVDHIISGVEGKFDNSTENLRWLPRRENIQKAYADGICDKRIANSKTPVMLHDWCTDEDIYTDSVQDAGKEVNVHYTSISHAINEEKSLCKGRYTARYADIDEIMYYKNMGCGDEF